jgi:anhydro-N-acetylmuramic acid kinase
MIDQCVKEFSSNKMQFDDKGRIAKKGNANALIKEIDKVLSMSYFQENLPKSQSTINFNFNKLSKSNLNKYSFADWAAAMTEITALSIVKDVDKFCNADKVEIYFCGGGSKNDYLIKRIESLLDENYTIKKIKNMGLDPMLVEACTFAWLGKKRIEKKKINLVNSTGAKPCLLGEIY